MSSLRTAAPRTAAAVVSGVAALCLSTSCAGTAVTSDRVDSSVGPAFARLYVLQQHRLGNDAVRRPDGVATCSRGAVRTPLRGAGDDWTCVLNFPFPDGHVQPITYDLQIQPSGCYTAAGPAQVVGPQHQRAATGATVTNPLFEFDGCFDVT